MSEYLKSFEGRLAEVKAYLELLQHIEIQIQSGSARIGNGGVLTAQQYRILCSSVYLQLYSLVESSVTFCLENLSKVIRDRKCIPAELSDTIKKEWVRLTAKTHEEMNYENRLQYSLVMLTKAISNENIESLNINKGGGGNWDDERIYAFFSGRLGCPLQFNTETRQSVKRPFRNDMGALKTIVTCRNDLAHGLITFEECGMDATVASLTELTDVTAKYLREFLRSFEAFMAADSYLQQRQQPALAS